MTKKWAILEIKSIDNVKKRWYTFHSIHDIVAERKPLAGKDNRRQGGTACLQRI